MSFITKIASAIGTFFTDLFNTAEKIYNELDPEVQTALKTGSGILAIVDANPGATSAQLLPIIQEAFPGTTEAQVIAALTKVTSTYTGAAAIIAEPTLDQALEAFQAWLATVNSKDSATVVAIKQNASVLMGIALEPNQTAPQKIIAVMEFVFTTYIEPFIVKWVIGSETKAAATETATATDLPPVE